MCTLKKVLLTCQFLIVNFLHYMYINVNFFTQACQFLIVTFPLKWLNLLLFLIWWCQFLIVNFLQHYLSHFSFLSYTKFPVLSTFFQWIFFRQFFKILQYLWLTDFFEKTSIGSVYVSSVSCTKNVK